MQAAIILSNSISDTISFSIACYANSEQAAMQAAQSNAAIQSEIISFAKQYGISLSASDYKAAISDAYSESESEYDLDSSDYAKLNANSGIALLELGS
jgi:hypothetical protein